MVPSYPMPEVFFTSSRVVLDLVRWRLEGILNQQPDGPLASSRSYGQ